MISIKKLPFIKRLTLIYLLICLVLLGLSCLGIIWGYWELAVCLGIGSIFGCFNIILLILGMNNISPDATSSKMWIIYISYLVRFILVALGLAISTIIIWKTMPDPEIKLRYLNLLGTGIPYFVSALAIILVKPEEENKANKQKDVGSSDNNTKEKTTI